MSLRSTYSQAQDEIELRKSENLELKIQLDEMSDEQSKLKGLKLDAMIVSNTSEE
ncbi:MAG: hypothetical protein HAW67_06875 [Endozoicomonadaceae bacterium]|nr:hypothetical protein [Endozoicomonadaceae bacterium]